VHVLFSFVPYSFQNNDDDDDDDDVTTSVEGAQCHLAPCFPLLPLALSRIPWP